ncbi:ABC transporter permease [Xylanimonas ulmi]|uniref:Peptide/nickel transport system permease protein n=1 Tax=Xylanimonas ulmi TaxID=228973 RepID=A0A4Q7M2P6_9MICO|nr:ABC transporter permease [Xylanibacterium ulmi]RZS60738.1 peptide/nickel transport system permease protein [Xylanibacterium ulmi]
MIRYLRRRSALLVASLIGAMLVIFALLHLLPGDPANALLSAGASPQQIAAARAAVGSDQPMWTQLGRWLGGLLHGDLGRSLASGQEVLPEVLRRMSVTVPMVVIAFVVSTVLATVIGYVAAVRHRRWYGILLSGLSQVGIGIPVFWVALVLVWIVALRLGWLPSGGYPREGWSAPGEVLRYLALPVASIVLGGQTAFLIRYIRSATLDVLGSDFLRTARALGMSRTAAFWRHGVRNAAVPVIAILGIELGTTVVGAVIVEAVFSLPGIGALLTKAILQHDYPSIQGALLATTFFVLIVGFAADLTQRLVDPRLRSVAVGSHS